ncbi:MAG TPA: hypothetical protein VLS51_09985, partial [Propionibacteriaceae bacterium]|nr:hypothetical protein [Propionibacteriaceae bacterium]
MDRPHAEAGPPQAEGAGTGLRPSTFLPGEEWRDTDGRLIEAHTGGMFVQDSTYYWVGASWHGVYGFRSFNLYSSTDLQTWVFRKTLLRPSQDLPATHEIARPKILYNAL